LPDSFGDNVAFALRAMGHEVIFAPKLFTRSPNPLVNIIREVRGKAFPDRWTAAETWAVRASREHRPDLVLCLTQAFRQEVLEALKKAGARRLVAWWGDTPANMTRMGLLAPGWDGIFIKDAAAVAKFRAVGLEAELLHEAMNPAWHRQNFESIGPDVVVAGNYYGYRQYLTGRLIEAGVPMALYGPAPPMWAAPAIRQAHRGRYIVREEKSRVFGEGLACLNSTALSEGDSLNCRAFEIAGACGLQLIEDKPSVASCFEPGSEVLTYSSIDSIVEHLGRARREPAWALRVRKAGHRRAHAHHTYTQRLDYILSRVGLAAGPPMRIPTSAFG
jgi:spore maturation protein CgeB